MRAMQKEEAAKEAASVPADDSQPACALSGERFETFWDNGREEWRFRDAVRLDAAQAARCACMHIMKPTSGKCYIPRLIQDCSRRPVRTCRLACCHHCWITGVQDCSMLP